MVIKIAFIGNSLGGDDGIGPILYYELKSDCRLSSFELIEGGVLGLDLLSYINKGDHLIIVDAVHSDQLIGRTFKIENDDLLVQENLVSQHDFGVAAFLQVIKFYDSSIRVDIIGINVNNLGSFDDKLSPQIIKELPNIKKKVIELIMEITSNG